MKSEERTSSAVHIKFAIVGLQEYMGSYVSSPSGKLVFREGALVEAIRCGYWIILDELNLAPSEVLEALNRLLDDNRLSIRLV